MDISFTITIAENCTFENEIQGNSEIVYSTIAWHYNELREN